MRTRIALLSAILVVGAICVVTVHANPVKNPPRKATGSQLVVRVHKSSKGLEFEMSPNTLKKGDANYWLAEIKLRYCTECQVIPIVDDNVELNAITQVSEMAINAGFKDIRPFVYWRKTGRMAEIQFGPPIKFTESPEKIEQRERSN